jgi:hypothetical protein
MNNKKVWIFLGALVILSAAFLFLNFRAAGSQTHTEKNMTTTSLGEGLPFAMQSREKISIALVGEGPLVSALQKALLAEIQNAGIGDIELVQGLEPTYPNPVLIVNVGKPGLFWTPFFATSRFSIQAGFASSGDTTFMSETPSTVDNSNGPVLNRYAEYKVIDRSWGLISRLGYHQLLADTLSHEIAAMLKELYQVG